LITHFKKQAKQYQELLKEQKEENWHKMIQSELEPLVKEVASLQSQINTLASTGQDKIDIILGSYKFRLIYLCKAYLRQGHLTED
jgi:protein subunit release factor A